MFDSKGNLYGTTPNGGAGCGIVYELSAPAAAGGEWTEAILYEFNPQGIGIGQPPGNDGCNPSGRLIFDKAGNLYGNTFNGGGGVSHSSFNGFGTTYKLHLANVKWTETILHSFTGEGTPDGENPAGGLAFDKAGNLWGATAFGGAVDCLEGQAATRVRRQFENRAVDGRRSTAEAGRAKKIALCVERQASTRTVTAHREPATSATVTAASANPLLTAVLHLP